MNRSLPTASALAVLAGLAASQGVLQKHPITTPVRDAGVLNWATGTWDRASGSFANAPGATVAFNNTCNWSGGAFFGGTYNCWQVYDEGRIPSSGDPVLGSFGAFDCQVICGFQFSYCTNDPGPYNAQIGFVQGINASGIGGRCAGVVQGITPPSNATKGLSPPDNFGDACDIYVDGTGAFPGAAAPPNQSCWLITIDLSTAFPNTGFSGVPFRAEGDCVYEGTPTNPDNDFDLFNWTFEQKGNTATNGAQGPFIVGGPAQQGAGAYGMPSGIDPLTGNPCGNGYGSFDNFWINVGTGPSPVGCAATGGLGVIASGCYFFGGFPGNPWASWHMVVWTSGEDCSDAKCGGVCAGFPAYCTAKTSSAGCVSSVGARGPGFDPCAGPTSGAADYSATAIGVQGFKPGLMFFGVNGAAAIPFAGGTLCMLPPLGRAPVQLSGGSNPTSCDGSFSQIINDGSVSPNLDQGPGTSNWVQFWNRDPGNGPGALGTQLSNAAQLDYN